MTTTSKGYGDYVVFVESKALRGRSKQEYLRQVRKLGEHYAGRELAGVTEREVFDYLVHRREVEKLRPSTLNQAVVALRMFYRDYLGKRWALWERFEIRRDRLRVWRHRRSIQAAAVGERASRQLLLEPMIRERIVPAHPRVR